jgi:sugar lactone lactonase YvrE
VSDQQMMSRSLPTHLRLRKVVVAILMATLLLLSVCGAIALAEGTEDSASLPLEVDSLQLSQPTGGGESDAIEAETIAVEQEVRNSAPPLTDPAVAEQLPHDELGRPEAAELMEGVFSPLLEMPAGIFDDLQVRSFISDHAAVIDASDVPGLVSEDVSEPTSESPILLESTIPLRSESEDGELGTVDLDLEQTAHALEPVNPLVDVSIPDSIGDGIKLPGTGISVSLLDAPSDRTPSLLQDSVAFYPNVAPDTDLAVAPTANGVETFTQLRTPEAPLSQTFVLGLPIGSRLVANEAGGAEVLQDGHQLVTVPRPYAVGAKGESVPVSLEVNGESLVVTVSPDSQTAYPIAVDPSIVDPNPCVPWDHEGWTSYRTPYSVAANSFQAQDGSSTGCLLLAAGNGTYAQGSQTYWQYAIPRYYKDFQDFGKRPTSWIQTFSLSEIDFNGNGNFTPDPMALFAVWDESGLWRTSSWYAPNLSGGYGINLSEDHQGKLASFGLFALNGVQLSVGRWLTTGGAQIGIGDNVAPEFGTLYGPENWLNKQAGPVTTSIGDAGLGVRKLIVRTKSGEVLGTTNVANIEGIGESCTGVARNPCPREWKSNQAGNQVKYDPALAPQGITNLNLEAYDPVDNVTARTLQIRVDHSSPSVELSGTLTEQGALGSKLSEYTLDYTAKDGDDAAATAVAPAGSAGKGEGQLERPMGVAVAPDGSIYTVDRLNNRVVKYDKEGKLALQFGSTGSGDGQFNDPRGIDIAPDGTVWVADMGNDRIQAFSLTGAFLRKAKFTDPASEPYAIASGPGGVLWVTDIGLHRLIKVSENPITTLLTTTGKEPGGNGKGTAVISPTGVATDKFGNVWIADGGLGKVLELDSAGKPLFSFGTGGSGDGQINGIVGIDVSPAGNIAITERNNGRVQIFKPDGSYLRKFGTAGSANNQFFEAGGLSFGPDNTLAIADAGNKRVARWAHADQDPQSGAAKVEVKVDGAPVHTKAPGCSTKNCSVSGSWTLDADEFAGGAHKVEVIATDAVGISQTKTIDIETHGDHTDPAIALSGTMTQQASIGTTRPSYKLKAVATDPGPAEELKSGVASTVIKVDGAVVDSSSPGCPSGDCSITREWTLNSDSYSVGSHTVEVKATDAAGRVSAKTLTIDIARDTTAPELSFWGALYSAPSGWLEQKAVGYAAYAMDSGYGVTSVELKIDGVAVSSVSQTCAAGGCSKFFGGSETLDMSEYSGGAHPAEFIARDGAGNVHKRTWTINVDPEGHISASEATDTLEAFEDTTVLQPVATTPEFLEPEIIAAGDNPHFVDNGEGFHATGIPVSVELGDVASDGFAVEGTAGKFEVTPVGESQALPSQLAGDNAAAVSSNTASGVDSVYRPEYNGLMLFSSIREQSSPEDYSWKVRLGATQTLESISSDRAAVFYEDGTEAFSITAETAKDAVGTQVPTTLTVSGSVITLTVQHKSGQYVYPVVAQQEYETPYNAPTIYEVPVWEGPPPPVETEEAEWIPSDDHYVTAEQANWFTSLNPLINDFYPFTPDTQPQVRTIYRTACGPTCKKWKLIVENAAYKTNSSDTTWWEAGTQVQARHTQHWAWAPIIFLNQLGCGVKGPLKVEKDSGQHLVAFGKFHIASFIGKKVTPTITPAYDKNFGLRVWVYPNGFQEKHVTGWDGLEGWECPTAVQYP